MRAPLGRVHVAGRGARQQRGAARRADAATRPAEHRRRGRQRAAERRERAARDADRRSPPASTGTRPKRSIARPAGSAASAPDASTIAGPSPSRPLTPTHGDQRQRGDGGRQLQHPRVGRQRGGEQRGVAADRQVGRHASRAQRYPRRLAPSRAWRPPHPRSGLRTIDPTPFRLRLERSKPRAAGARAGRAGRACSRDLDRRIRAVRARLRRAVGRAARPRPARRLPLGRRGQPHEGLVSAGHRGLGRTATSCSSPGTTSPPTPRASPAPTVARGRYRHVRLDHRRRQAGPHPRGRAGLARGPALRDRDDEGPAPVRPHAHRAHRRATATSATRCPRSRATARRARRCASPTPRSTRRAAAC